MVREERNEELQNYGGLEAFEKEATLYPMHDKPGIHWGMSVDLNTCIGCQACVVACHIENNVPIVGKKEVARFHDMHWLRIDRYFSGDANDPESIQTVFQPMLCQHCDNAPCENVCPVAATPHSQEGLNMMTYNRCIGTRYCANNCPYKVRRFNWADYTGADSFKNNQKPLVEEGTLDDVVLMMSDDLTRMVLNPDVTVRSRGVMEKCTFCVQRLQEGKLRAKKENRPILTGSLNAQGEEQFDVQTACQQACPTNAIVFGNQNDRNSVVMRSRHDNALRLFYSLEQIHTLPNVSYLTKVRNTDVLSAHATHGDLLDGQKEVEKPEVHG
jgi:molybdopterin-containing oxidoreductase family iron-sulfur binding subunit